MNIYGHVLPSMQRDTVTELDGFFKWESAGEGARFAFNFTVIGVAVPYQNML
jgi:hypothetical protein